MQAPMHMPIKEFANLFPTAINHQLALQQTLVISTLFYQGFTKICRYNL